MLGFIDGYDFKEMEPMKYWAPPSSWTEEKKKETTRSRIFSGDWWAAEKKDGYFSKLVKDEDGNILLFSRSRNTKGEFPEKHEWVPHLNDFFSALPNGTCILGELYLPSKPGSSNITTLLGCLKEKCVARQEKGEKLHFYAFDILAYEGESYMGWRALDRFNKIRDLKDEYRQFSEFVEFANYVNEGVLWNKLQEILASGGEGMVITRGDALYQPGKRPSKDCQKVKKELSDTVDAFFTGRATPATVEYKGKEIETWQYWENTMTGERFLDNGQNTYKRYVEGETIRPITKGHYYGWAGSLEVGVLKDGKIVPVGFLSGLPDEVKANVKSYAMKPFEMTAMQITEDGAFRHGKFLNWRSDLAVEDCTWEKVFN